MNTTPSSVPSAVDVAAVVAAVRRVIPAERGRESLHEPEFRGNEWLYTKECLDTGWVSSVGQFVERFEAQLSEYTGARYAIATTNGTAALHICLQLVGVQRGDEVLVPTLTFIATANAVSYTGATPHFVDSEMQSFGVDAGRLEAYLANTAVIRDGRCINRHSGATIRALMPMHTFGHSVDLEALVELCTRWHIALVEDAAESLGTFYKDRHTGTFGAVAGLSFNGNKIVTTGGGGAVLTNDPELARRARHLTTTARVAHEWSFIHDEVGYNYRLPNLNAALGCAQLEQLPDFLSRKRNLAARYAEAFRDISGVRFVSQPPYSRSNYWLNTILLDQPNLATRDSVLRALNDAGVMSRPVWTLMHELPIYAHCPRMDVSRAESLEQQIINLPSSARLGH